MQSSYYDIDAILAEEEKIPVTVNATAKRLGYLDPSCRDVDLVEGTKMEIPLWTIPVLREPAYGELVTVNWPTVYKANARSALIADARVARLTPHYYSVGLALAAMNGDIDFLQVLQKAFVLRYKDVLDKAYNMIEEDHSTFLDKFADVEKRLFEAGRQASKNFTKYKRRDSRRLHVSSQLAPSKRKLSDLNGY